MIPFLPHQHQAHYDEDGNIIIPPVDDSANFEEKETARNAECGMRNAGNNFKPDSGFRIPDSDLQQQKQNWKQVSQDIQQQFSNTLQSLLTEGARQYRWSFINAKESAKSGRKGLRSGWRRTWAFLTQPVWVPGRNKKSKEYSRITLFMLDTVRFGGTFAMIFVALFVSLNYQSFWSIVVTHINPIDHIRNAQALTASVDTALKEKLLRSPSLAMAGGSDGNLLAFLPNIGPPENRMIIPKLGLNIPLVTPSYDALLREDWDQVEKDIQNALQMGIVHYPGTAKPGQAGNFFVTGHSSYYPWAPGKYKTVFALLHELKPGDDYWVYYGGDKHRYIVRNKREVKATDVSVLDQPIEKRIATLMTCTPIGTTLRRLVITAEEVDPQTGIALKVGERSREELPKMQAEALPI